jgi:hypothetical protein
MKITIGVILIAVALSEAGLARAQTNDVYLYTINSKGQVSVNGNKINRLPGDYDPDIPGLDPEQAWQDIAVEEGNHYGLRADGQMTKNGVKLWKLPYDAAARWYWIKLRVVAGTTYALRQDGKMAVNEKMEESAPRDGFIFNSLQVLGNNLYALRSDGAVFRNSETSPVFKFQGGPGLSGSGDGGDVDTVWVALKPSPDGHYLYALRSDGRLHRGELPAGNSAGFEVETLPFPTRLEDYTFGDLYPDFEFDDVTGHWLVLQLKGRVYEQPDADQFQDDYPGNGRVEGELYLDLTVINGRYFALRDNGRIYAEGVSTELVTLDGRAYGRIEPSTLPPVLSGQKNNAPNVVTYTVPVNTGGLPVRIPVVATDVETPTDQLTITPVSLPAGAAWDALTQELTWTSPDLKGNYTFSYIVDDGDGSTKTYSSKIQVKDPDLDPVKNKKPSMAKVKGAAALIGEEYRLLLPVSDPDNDPVTVTVDLAAYPFSSGAVYAPDTGEFIWTPGNADIGKHTIEFGLSDGVATATFKLKLEVQSPLYIPPLPE